MNDIPNADAQILDAIEKKIFSSIRLGADWSELAVLDDVNANRKNIQDLGSKITANNPEIAATILEIAHAIYFGNLQQGDVPDFFDAVIRLGADRVKMLVFALALFSLSKTPDARIRAAKSAAICALGRIMAEELGLRDELVRKVETGGLLSQLGKSILMKARELGLNISDEFFDKYEKHLAASIIERLGLDPFIKKAIDLSVVEFDGETVSLVGIIKLAEAVTEDSFRRYGKLVLKSPMPDKDNILVHTPGEDIMKLFTALGVEEFLEVQEAPTERQLEARKKKESRPKNRSAA